MSMKGHWNIGCLTDASDTAATTEMFGSRIRLIESELATESRARTLLKTYINTDKANNSPSDYILWQTGDEGNAETFLGKIKRGY